MKEAVEGGRWGWLNVLGVGVFFAAVPAAAALLYELAQRGPCGGRLQAECDLDTSNLIIAVVLSCVLVLGLGQWILLGYHLAFRRRIPARQLLATYLSVFGVALCVGIAVTRESAAPAVAFTVIALGIAGGEAVRLVRLPDRRNPRLLLRAADVPAGADKRQQNATPWTGPLTAYESRYYLAMAAGFLTGAVVVGLLLGT
ncbi:hypothetical protein [Streptomyces capoamus]|uniref:hypothetical protein n=1 Tax=Streptomyces capoamus TaxID=68183 RepID=UPI003392FC05